MSAAPANNGNGVDKRVAALEQGYAVMQADVTGIKAGQVEQNAKLDSVLSRMSNQGKPNWAAISVMATVVGALYALVTMPMERRISANEKALEIMSTIAGKVAISEVNDSQSMTDRTHLNEAVGRASAQIASLEKEIARMNTQSLEQEGQHNSNDNIRALQDVEKMRYLSLLWSKVYGQPLPEYQFYPKTAQDRVVK